MADPPRRGRLRRSWSFDDRPTPEPEPGDEGQDLDPLDVPHGNERVLLVEDQDQVREVARAILQRLGYDVVTAADADEGLRLALEGQAPDLLVTDVVLPSMNGVTLAERVVGGRPGVRVLFMSAFTLEAAVPESEVGGSPCGFLLKPFNLALLGRAVREVLDREG